MNQLIDDLARRAGWQDDHQFSTHNKLYQWQSFSKERFVELIVCECIETLRTGKRCDPYTGEELKCPENDTIDKHIGWLICQLGTDNEQIYDYYQLTFRN